VNIMKRVIGHRVPNSARPKGRRMQAKVKGDVVSTHLGDAFRNIARREEELTFRR